MLIHSQTQAQNTYVKSQSSPAPFCMTMEEPAAILSVSVRAGNASAALALCPAPEAFTQHRCVICNVEALLALPEM